MFISAEKLGVNHTKPSYRTAFADHKTYLQRQLKVKLMEKNCYDLSSLGRLSLMCNFFANESLKYSAYEVAQ